MDNPFPLNYFGFQYLSLLAIRPPETKNYFKLSVMERLELLLRSFTAVQMCIIFELKIQSLVNFLKAFGGC